MKKHALKIGAALLAILIFVTAVIIFPLGTGETGLLPGPMEVIAGGREFSAPVSGLSAELPHLSVEEALAGQLPRDGYILAPTIFGVAGIDPMSAFVLRTEASFDEGDAPLISIDGQPAPDIEREDGHTFIVIPRVPLTPNSIYAFRLAREGAADVVWVFQTAKRFEILGTLPRNQSTNVPVRTGIEINFSHGSDIDISEHFVIYPHAEGRFLHRDSTVIFSPSEPLEQGRIYTVTLRPGIALPGTGEILTTGHSFVFETERGDTQGRPNESNAHVHFSRAFTEFPSFAAPQIHFWLSYWGRNARPALTMSVYRFEDLARGIAAANRISGIHWWSAISWEENIVDTEGLQLVHSSVITVPQQDPDHWNEIFILPDNLPRGLYLINAETECGSVSQAMLHITDLAVQIVADTDRAIFWINDMHTGNGAAAARVYDPINRQTYTATEYGIAIVERELQRGEYFIVTFDDMESVVFIHQGGHQHFWGGGWGRGALVSWDMSWDMWDYWGWMPSFQAQNSRYWTALQLDRTLFQRNDTLHLWGFVQNRRVHEEISHVTAVLTEHNWWRWDSMAGNDTLHRQNIPVAYGAYNAEIRLPHLDPGAYEIAIFHGDELLNSMFFSVRDYVKPPYQLLVSSDLQAVFAGEEVTFTARTEFFEGTPVPDLSISHSMHGWELNVPNAGRTSVTDISGEISVSARPTAQVGQGIRNLNFVAEATLPEIGWTHQSANVRVFINDITVRPRAFRDGADATLNVNVYNITLDRLNDGTAEHSGDFLDTPRAGQRINVEIIEHYWERVQRGYFYCHVLRQNVPRYRHIHRKNTVLTFQVTTDADGAVSHNFTVPDRYRRSYEAVLTTTDGNGRAITHNVFIGQNWDWFFNAADGDRLFLDGINEDGYDIGDPIELTVMRGTEKLEQGNFLFVVVQDGILSYHIGVNPLNLTFTRQYVPNVQIFAYHFNGHVFTSGGQMGARLRYNPVNRELNITVEACSESYRPGEPATFTIRTTDIHGNPKPANVNISIVDEALFALMDYTVDTLAMLYGDINDRLHISFATHSAFVSDGIDVTDGGQALRLDSGDFYALETAAPMADMAVADDAGGGGGGDAATVRERFEDTAMFASIRTNAQGVATLTVPLPHNITTWRVTASAISECLYAGNTVESLRVTLPMFVHYTLNNVFLTGDVPVLGVNAFGTALGGGEAAEFRVWRENAPGDVRTATGTAFERVNIPLWEMPEEGHGAIIIQASAAGYSDAVRHEYQVLNSHRLIDTATFYEVTPATVFATNPGGLTNITFTDRGRGQFLNDLFGMRHTWFSGARIEGLVANREATALIGRHFPETRLFGTADGFDILDYQQANGGLSVLPYADAELGVTVALLPFVADDVNRHSLRNYLQNIFETSAGDNRMLALYGLAMLGEPVLLELRAYAALEGLSVRNAAYVGLGFAALGDAQAASEIWQNRVAPNIQAIAPYYRIVADGSTRTQILDATSVVALLAARLGRPEALGLFNYAANARFETIQGWRRPNTAQINAYMLLKLERLAFIAYEIENHTASEAVITYTLFGETVTRELGHGGAFTLRIPAASMNEFRIVSVQGDVGAVSVTRTPLEDIEPLENHITVTRRFFSANSQTPATTFRQDEIIRVEIRIDYSAIDVTGTYIITDFLPAGLVHVPDSARINWGTDRGNHIAHAWVQTEGQRITFFDHNHRFNRVHTYFYYARVVNPGTFRAEGTIVQSQGVREYMVVGEDAVITVN